MYLFRRTYVKNWGHLPEKHKIKVKLNGKKHPFIDPLKIMFITEELANWSKANQIHKWFVENCQKGEDDCGEYFIDVFKLMELLSICKMIKENNNLAKDLLPSCNGFFFGSTEYDEYYLKNIDYTIEVLETIKQQNEKEVKAKYHNSEYYYQSSW